MRRILTITITFNYAYAIVKRALLRNNGSKFDILKLAIFPVSSMHYLAIRL